MLSSFTVAIIYHNVKHRNKETALNKAMICLNITRNIYLPKIECRTRQCTKIDCRTTQCTKIDCRTRQCSFVSPGHIHSFNFRHIVVSFKVVYKTLPQNYTIVNRHILSILCME